MNRICNRTKWLYAFAVAFAAALIFLYFSFFTNAKTWVVQDYNQHIYSNGQLVGVGSISDRNGKPLVKTEDGKRVYNPDIMVRKATFHVIGDAEGFVSTGAQNAFKSQLTGYSLFNGLYGIHTNEQYNMKLTIDNDLSVTALQAMGVYKGAVGVYNYKTGEILCMVSNPTYDPAYKPDINPESPEWSGVYMNRFISGTYTPGSTFKIITAASALENIPDIKSQTFNCPGYYQTKSGGKVTCLSRHGRISLREALNQSCNSAFSQIASAELTNEQLTKTAEEFGFNKSIDLDGIKCAKSKIDLSHAYDIDRAWAGIGQYTTMVNPCQEITVLGAIANKNGKTPNPTIIKKDFYHGKQLEYCSPVVAADLDDLLRSNVVNYYRDSRFEGLQMCGKTGTAEVANAKCHSWFVGYSQRTDLPLAIVVIAENTGASGFEVAIPIANQVMQKAATIDNLTK